MIHNSMVRSTWCLAVAAVTLTVGNASAGYISVNSGDKIKLADGPGSISGGEFIVTANDTDQNNPSQLVGTYLFSTFCVELNQTINLADSHTVSNKSNQSDMARNTINSAVTLGMYGVLGTSYIPTANSGGTNFLSIGAAILYKGFAEGLRTYGEAVRGSGYEVTIIGNEKYRLGDNIQTGGGGSTAREAAANDLQNAIWYFQRQQVTGDTNRFVTAVNAYLGGLGTDFVDDSFAMYDGVNIIDLHKSGGTTDRQSQLHYDWPGLSTNPVPEPASCAMWLTLAVGAAFARRRRASLAG